MGIESFFGRYISRNYKSAIESKLPDRIGSVFIDCNGIFHSAAQKVYGYGDYEGAGMAVQDDNTLVKEILFKIEEVLRVTAPEDNFILAPDGVAVAAKLNQQKSRRYLSAASRTISFDSNQFTPGTDLMIKIDERIKGWLNYNKKLLPKKVIYSSHLDPGEGEHKIFQFIRERQIIESDGKHILYGLDSDLIILSLLSPLKNIYLMREDYRSMVNIDRLRELIVDKFYFEGANRNMIIKDFSIIVMFAGNDFLPKLPSFTDIGNFLEIFRRLYVNGKRHLIDDTDNIDFQTLYRIMKKFNDVEDKLLIKIVRERLHKFPYPELTQCVSSSGLDTERFTNLWYCKQFCPAIGQLASLYEDNQYYTEQEIGKMSIEFLKTMQWVYKYYTEGYKGVSNTHFYPFIYAPFGKSLYSTLDMIYSDKRKLRGRIKKLQDVSSVKNIDITAVHQLMSVIPRRSAAIIPQEAIGVYDSIMVMISPDSFTIKHEGTNADWHHTAIIPPINVKLAEYALSTIPKYTTPERFRERGPIILENLQYVPKRRYPPKTVRKKMDSFIKTKRYKIQDINLL